MFVCSVTGKGDLESGLGDAAGQLPGGWQGAITQGFAERILQLVEHFGEMFGPK